MSKTKLADTQLVILAAAAQRDDGAALPLPKSLKIKGAAVTKTLEGLLKKGLLDEKPAPRAAVPWREDKDSRRMMLVITDAGMKAIEGETTGEVRTKPVQAKAQSKQPRPQRKTPGTQPKRPEAMPAVRQGTKQALLIDLLKRKKGATIGEIVEATGWQAHSVRGAISGTLKKKLGLAVASKKADGRGRVYRIAECG